MYSFIIQTVHILQHDSADKCSLPMEYFLKHNPNYFKITQPDRSTVTPQYKWDPFCIRTEILQIFRYLNPVPQGSVPLSWILPSAFQMIVLVGKPFGLLTLLTFMSSNMFLLLQSFLVLNKGRFLELISGAPIKFRLYTGLLQCLILYLHKHTRS